MPPSRCGPRDARREGATAASLADEIDEIREPALRGVEFGLLEPQRVRGVATTCPLGLLSRAALGHSDHVRPEEPSSPPPNIALKIAAREAS